VSKKAVSQYLERHAEAEIHAVESLEGEWDFVVVLPACGEDPDLLDTFESVDLGTRRLLCVLVVNRVEGSSVDRRERNRRVLAAVREGGDRLISIPAEHPIELISRGEIDWLVIDRDAEGHALPEGQGVGLARKVGCDVALAAWNAGRVRCEWIWTTDADVRVPPDYFDVESALGESASRISAVTMPFRHEVDLSTVEGRALGVYEVRLRYYTLGLARAGSPYAVETVGSTFCIRASSYASVRGFPRRNAGEDFYLINKLAKVGGVTCPRLSPIRIRQRESDRVPFGTGQATAEISALDDAESYAVYSPEVYIALERWIAIVDEFVSRRNLDATLSRIRTPRDPLDRIVIEALGAAEIEQRFVKLWAQHSQSETLRRALHTWFDAFRTFKFVHALRDRFYPSIPIRDALQKSEEFSEMSDLPLDSLIDAMFRKESELIGRVFGIA